LFLAQVEAPYRVMESANAVSASRLGEFTAGLSALSTPAATVSHGGQKTGSGLPETHFLELESAAIMVWRNVRRLRLITACQQIRNWWRYASAKVPERLRGMCDRLRRRPARGC
jgi:hypothetical protein